MEGNLIESLILTLQDPDDDVSMEAKGRFQRITFNYEMSLYYGSKISRRYKDLFDLDTMSQPITPNVFELIEVVEKKLKLHSEEWIRYLVTNISILKSDRVSWKDSSFRYRMVKVVRFDCLGFLDQVGRCSHNRSIDW